MAKIPVSTKADKETGIPIVKELTRRLDVVRQRAFERFQKRGEGEGQDLDDWFLAEKDVMGWPTAELKERNGEYEVEVSLAGFAPTDIDVVADQLEVIVHATSSKSASGADGSVVWSEFGSNEVFRRLPFPQNVDASHVRASFDNGLLRIHAPKAPQATPVAPTA